MRRAYGTATGRRLRVFGTAWYPNRAEAMAGFVYGLDQDGSPFTHATADVDYHEMVAEAFRTAGEGEPIEVDYARYDVATEGWSLDNVEFIEDPREGWTVGSLRLPPDAVDHLFRSKGGGLI